MIQRSALSERAALHAALGDPIRLGIVDHLMVSDRSPHELERLVEVPSNLLAHHLDVLESAGLIERHRSSGDGRRRYVHLRCESLRAIGALIPLAPQPVLFVCTANSARSQLAAALWTAILGQPATSAGTHPAADVHPGAIAAAERVGLDLTDARPTRYERTGRSATLIITVCDRAHEELEVGDDWLHWSIPDPVARGTAAAFDATVTELRQRIALVAGAA